MTDKLKITKQQEKALDLFNKGFVMRDESDYKLMRFAENRKTFKGDTQLHSLRDFTTEQFALWLCGWYEVEQPYQEKDWVIYNGRIVQIDTICKGGTAHTPYVMNFSIGDRKWHDYEAIERRATDEEIIEEQLRLKWNEIGRDIGEFKTGDITWYDSKGEFLEIVDAQAFPGGDMIAGNRGNTGRVSPVDLELVCPVEQRFDAKEVSHA